MSENTNHIGLLVKKHLSGELSLDEQQELKDWLARSEKNRVLLEELSDTGKVAGELNKLHSYDETGSREKINVLFPELRQRKVFVLKRWAAAASILFLIGTVSYFIFTTKEKPATNIAVTPVALVNDALPGGDHAILTMPDGRQIRLDSTEGALVKQDQLTVTNKDGKLSYEGVTGEVQYHTLSTPKGGTYKVVLPDNTEAWLNAASSIKYPTAFTGNSRSVEITGEVYFEVAKDASKKFLVHTGDMTTEVLGTHFNINAYRNEGSPKVTLLEGSVKVTSEDGPGQSIMLKPGFQASLSGNGQLKTTSDIDLEEVMAWKNGLFKFNNADIETVMRQVERWYDLEVIFEGPKPEGHFEGKITRKVKASEMLKVIAVSGINYRIEEKKMIVTK